MLFEQSIPITLVVAIVALLYWRSNPFLGRRALALGIDVALMLAVLPAAVHFLSSLLPPNIIAFELYLVLGITLPPAIWALFESSDFRATPGKLLVKIAVSNRRRTKPSFVEAFIRNLVKWLSITNWPLLLVNIAFYHFKGKALHELLINSSSFQLSEGMARKLGDTKVYLADHSVNLQFEDHEQAGLYGETLLLKELERLKSKGIILDYGSTKNMVFEHKNFEMDAYALVQGVGIFVLEAKFYSGKVYLSHLDMWDNIKADGSNAPKQNPCLQLERTASLFRDLLDSKYRPDWPIYPVVMLTHPGVEMASSDSPPQYPVLTLPMLEDQLRDSFAPDQQIAFTTRDCEEIRALLLEHEKAYVDRSPEFA